MGQLPVVFTIADARRHGYSPWQITRLRRSGEWVALHRGTFCTRAMHSAATENPGLLHGLRAQARLRALDRAAWISHCSAAYLHGLVLPPKEPRKVSLTAEVGSARSSASLEIQLGAVPPSHRSRLAGLSVTSAARTVADLARHLRPADAVAAGDSALRRGVTSREEILAVLDDCASWRGVIAARRSVERMDGRRETWLESASMLLIVEHGLPEPTPQVWIAYGGDEPFARVDFLWNPPGVIGEADGAVKYATGDSAVLLAEKRRQERLEYLGFVVVRWDTQDVIRHPWHTAHRIQAALDRAWQARTAGVPLLATCIPTRNPAPAPAAAPASSLGPIPIITRRW